LPALVFVHGWGQTDYASGVHVPVGDLVQFSGFFEYFGQRIPAVVDLPFVVIVPQCDNNNYGCWGWVGGVPLVQWALENAESQQIPIDRHRLYITGLSTGGEGVYRVALTFENDATIPYKVAAIVPLMSTWDPDAPMTGYMLAPSICAISNIPIWAFHSSSDTLQVPQNDQRIIDAMNASCAPTVPAMMTSEDWTYMGSHHAGFEEAYNNLHHGVNQGETSIYPWLLRYSR
jgi:predicted peptidase